jgi:ribosome-binding factor A
MPSLRLQRVNELLKREIGEVVRRDFSISEAGLITINSVEVSGDLRHANVYASVLGTDPQKMHALALLEKKRQHIQEHIGHSVVLKFTPQLRFVLDDSIERGNRVLRIIEDLEKENPLPPPQPDTPKP